MAGCINHAALQLHDSASLQDQTATWEDVRLESKHAKDLPQLENGLGKFGRHVPSDPALWECDGTGVKENLWLNLSTGFIGSGRQACLCVCPVQSMPSKRWLHLVRT